MRGFESLILCQKENHTFRCGFSFWPDEGFERAAPVRTLVQKLRASEQFLSGGHEPLRRQWREKQGCSVCRGRQDASPLCRAKRLPGTANGESIDCKTHPQGCGLQSIWGVAAHPMGGVFFCLGFGIRRGRIATAPLGPRNDRWKIVGRGLAPAADERCSPLPVREAGP